MSTITCTPATVVRGGADRKTHCYETNNVIRQRDTACFWLDSMCSWLNIEIAVVFLTYSLLLATYADDPQQYAKTIRLSNASDRGACLRIFVCFRVALKMIDDFSDQNLMNHIIREWLPEDLQEMNWDKLEVGIVCQMGNKMGQIMERSQSWWKSWRVSWAPIVGPLPPDDQLWWA